MIEARRVWRPRASVNVHEVLSPLMRGPFDPAIQVAADGAVWWATTTPDGLGTLRLTARAPAAEVAASAWGTGAGWLLERVPRLLGDRDDCRSFVPSDQVVRAAWKRHSAWRPLRTERCFDACVAAVVEQKVTSKEARQSWRMLLRRFGEPAPGPAPHGMFAPPPPKVWLGLADWDFHHAGMTPQRTRTLRVVAHAAHALERAGLESSAELDRVLRTLPGIGQWTSAETRQRSHGDADAVSFGDFHLAKDLCWWLTGERGDDHQLSRLLEPYAGHRYRVQRLMELSQAHAPRRGPRMTIPAHRFA